MRNMQHRRFENESNMHYINRVKHANRVNGGKIKINKV